MFKIISRNYKQSNKQIKKGIINVILPCLSYPDDNLKKGIKELTRSINSKLWSIIENFKTDQKYKNYY